LVAFARSLRRAGVAVPVDNVVQYVRAIEAVGIDRRDPVYWAGRAVLIHRHEDVGTYDRIFDSFWWGGSGVVGFATFVTAILRRGGYGRSRCTIE
jgi:uncharacterized protein with von Willebrand factor type A (vWA) domain